MVLITADGKWSSLWRKTTEHFAFSASQGPGARQPEGRNPVEGGGSPLWCCCQARTPGLCLGYSLYCQQKHLLKWLGTCVFLELFLDDGSRNSLELVGTQNGNWLEGWWSVSRNAQRFRTGPIGFVSSSVYKAGDSSHVSHHIMNSSHLKKRLIGLPAKSAFLWKGLWIKGPLLVH